MGYVPPTFEEYMACKPSRWDWLGRLWVWLGWLK